MPLLLNFVLLTTGSLAVVVSRILTTCSSAVVPSVILFFRVTLWQVTTPWLVSGLPPTSLLSIAPFVIDGSRQVPSIHGKVVYNNVCFCAVWSEGFVAAAARRCSPMPLCDTQSSVHLHDEGFRRGPLSRRGPLVLPTPQGGHRSSFVWFWFLSLVLSLSHATSLRVL